MLHRSRDFIIASAENFAAVFGELGAQIERGYRKADQRARARRQAESAPTEVERLSAEVERLRAALAAIGGTEPLYEGGTGTIYCVYCDYCDTHHTPHHEVDCPWLVARSLLPPE